MCMYVRILASGTSEDEIVVTGTRMSYEDEVRYDFYHPEIYFEKNYRKPGADWAAYQQPGMTVQINRNVSSNQSYITAAGVSTFASRSGAIFGATEEMLIGAGKGKANSILSKASNLPSIAAKMDAIIEAGSFNDARSVIKTPTAKSAVAMSKFAPYVTGAHYLGGAASIIEFGADMWADPTIGTIVAGEVNIAAGAGAAYVGGEAGLTVGTGISLFFPPAAPIIIPVATGVGAAIGYGTYEFGGGSDWVKSNVKSAFNGTIEFIRSAPQNVNYMIDNLTHPFNQFNHSYVAP
jgi:hypothetical protein